MTDAIRVDPVVAYTGGWLGMTFTPGKRDEGYRGSHWRDLDLDIATLRDVYRIATFLWLIEDHELPMLQVERLPEAMAAAGIELIRYPIVDLRAPSDAATFRELLDDLHARLARGERIAVACRGGCGRTGTVVGCLLRDQGLDAEAAIDATRLARHCAIETARQEQFVREWTAGEGR